MGPEQKHTNRLIHETSPYLLQHAHNPVEWHAWNPETLEKAKTLDKMLLISIGYSACHWCHVMEHESFADEEVARIMNENFICIKVDREERPDVDHIYMQAVQLITGGGGWPLNCFALPDGKPFFGGTYFRKNQWTGLLENISLLFETRRKDLEEQAAALTQGISETLVIPVGPGDVGAELPDLEMIIENLKRSFDMTWGGLSGAPKFPMPALLSFLLRYQYHSDDKEVLAFVETTLEKMAFGGIYDQIGGGFARYSTDRTWTVPHFEKMLYDNAQMVSLYSDAYSVNKNPLYKEVVIKTLRFIEDEMGFDAGGFYAALDADSEGMEGKFYTWTEEEIRKLLGSKADLFLKYYRVGLEGSWEGNQNILLRTRSMKDMASQLRISVTSLSKLIASGEKALLKERKNRIRPGMDDKALAAWNGMMLTGLVDAWKAFGKSQYLQRAIKTHDFIAGHMSRPDGGLWHTWKENKPSINGFLDDYAFVIRAFIDIYKATTTNLYLEEAVSLLEYVLNHFQTSGEALLNYTSDEDSPLVARKHDFLDTVIPSSNSVMADVLLELGTILERHDFHDRGRKMIQAMSGKMERNPASMANWCRIMQNVVSPYHTVVVAGEQGSVLASELLARYLPNALIVYTENPTDGPLFRDRFAQDRTNIYVCTGNHCSTPVQTVAEALEWIEK